MSADPRRDDARARAAAQREFARPLVLEAGAGTGKTATLVARVVAWVLGEGWERARARDPDKGPRAWARSCLARVVAITFTEAAAAEMAERVGQALVAVQAGEPVVGFDPELLPADDGPERARALVESLDHLVVRTIHAWCRRILARRPLEAGLHPAFEVDAEGDGRAEAIRSAVEETLSGPLGSATPDALVALAAEGVGPDRVAEALEALVAEGVRSRDLAADPFAAPAVAASLSGLDGVVEGLLAAGARALDGKKGVPGQVHAALRSTRSAVAAGTPGSVEALEAWLSELGGLWEGSARKRLDEWARGRFTNAEQDDLSDLPAVSAAADALRKHLDALLRVDVPLHQLARRALAPLLEDAQERMRRRGQVSFPELLGRTAEMLEGSPALRGALRRDIDLLLVDEFQDTDPRQCAIVGQLALEGPQDERPSLFVVGDPKQSIYGWRSADLGAYDDFVERILGEGGERLHLCVNFRSVPAVLDEVERVVAPVMREARGLQPAYQPLVPCEGLMGEAGFEAADAGAVEHWLTDDRDPGSGEVRKGNARRFAEVEAGALAGDLLRRHRDDGVPWKHMGVLLRAQGDLEIYLAAMRELGVPYAVERDQSYFQRREIIDAAAAVRCVVDPQDHLALLTWLRSPAVGVPDAALIPLWTRGFPKRVTALAAPGGDDWQTLSRLVEEAARATPDDVPGLEALGDWAGQLVHALEGLAILRQGFAREPVDRFVEALRRTGLAEVSEANRFLGAWRGANLDRFFRQLAEDLARGLDVHSVLRRLRASVAEAREADAGRPGDPSLDAVAVMTIHKSKGLAFEHVYLPQLHRGRGGGGGPAVRVEWRGERPAFELFGWPDLGLAAALGRREAVAANERVRELYVAMTRARRRLVLMGRRSGEAVPPGRAKSLADLLGSRRGPFPDIDAVAEVQRSGDPRGEVDAQGVCWRVPSLLPAEEPARDDRGPALPEPDEIAGQAGRLARARAQAGARMERPHTGRATSAAEEPGAEEPGAWALRQARAERGEEPGAADAGRGGARREVATVAGSAVHRALEEWDFANDPAEEHRRQRDRARAWSASQAGPADGPRAAEVAAEALDAFVEGPLFGRWLALAPAIVARELPLLRKPEESEEGPVLFESGIIDLVYRDPQTDEWVIADYKTDRVESRAECEEHAERYRPQGEFYQQALRESLDLEGAPRFELWFLRAGEVVST
ncbi:MAG: UvrD-helicase domain-containing protein [Myxococcota bacterium]